MAQLTAEFPEDLRFVYRHFPLSSHDKAFLAAQAAEAAGMQGRFWEMHDLFFGRVSQWGGLSLADFETWAAAAAAELDLDEARFRSDLNSAEIKAQVQDSLDFAVQVGLPGTPTLAINGQYYDGPRDFYNLAMIIKLIKHSERQYTSCPEITIDPGKQYFATLETGKGKIVLELYPKSAPIAVNSFVFLAREGYYDGVTFHRVIPGQVAQAGDPTGTGLAGAGYTFVNEIDPALKYDKPGVLGMANAGPDSNGSQFFITYKAAEQYNGSYTIFGQVISGMDVLEQLTPRNPAQDPTLPPGDMILKVTIEEK